MSELLLDAAGRRRSPATLPAFHAGRAPRNKGMRYPADPPTTEEIVTVMRSAGDTAHGRRLRGLIVVLWRAGLRICEALALAEADLDPRRGVAARATRQGRPPPRGRHGRLGLGTARALAHHAGRAAGRSAVLRRQRLHARTPVGGRRCPLGAAPPRPPGRRAATLRAARTPPRPCRRDGPRGVPLLVIQRQLGHTNLGITSIYLQGIDNTEIIDTVHARRAPMILVNSSLRS